MDRLRHPGALDSVRRSPRFAGQSYSGQNGTNGTPIVIGPDTGVDAPPPAAGDVHGDTELP